MTRNVMAEEKTSDKLRRYEKKVVASILFNKEVKDFALENEIDTRFFTVNIYQKVMNVFNSLSNSFDSEPTPEIILEQIEPTENELPTWKKLFEDLQKETSDLETVKTYLLLLRKQYKVNRWQEFADELKELVDSEKINPLNANFDEMDKEIDHKFSTLLEDYSHSDKVELDIAGGFELVAGDMNEALHSESRDIFSTGYEELDKVYNGGHLRGTYSIYAARPAMGKTVYMLNEALESAKKGTKSIFISIEMTMIQCFQRIVAKLAGIDSGKLQQPKEMLADDWKKLKLAAEEVVELFANKLWIIEVSQLNNARLRRIIQDYKRKHDIDNVYVDYVQIMSTDKGGKPETESDYASISQGLRITCKEEGVHIGVGSQINRGVENRDDKRPKASDLRNSGAFEQDAARIVGLYRDEVYNKETEEPNIMEALILKNRFGDSNLTIKLKYDIKKQSIYSIA